MVRTGYDSSTKVTQDKCRQSESSRPWEKPWRMLRIVWKIIRKEGREENDKEQSYTQAENHCMKERCLLVPDTSFL